MSHRKGTGTTGNGAGVREQLREAANAYRVESGQHRYGFDRRQGVRVTGTMAKSGFARRSGCRAEPDEARLQG
jgi:hypothetical protein